MSKQFFNTVMRGTEEARAYMEGARDGYRVTESPSINAKSWAKIREAMPPESQAQMDDRLKKVLGGTVPLDNVRTPAKDGEQLSTTTFFQMGQGRSFPVPWRICTH